MEKYLPAAIDSLSATSLPKGCKWGLVTNDAALTATNLPVRQKLLGLGYQLSCLFAPEHGINAGLPDGSPVPFQVDKLTGLPVYSLYAGSFSPPGEVLQALDGVLFDLPDVGCRFYTYLWTLTYIMEACAYHQKPLYVFDRANPLGGIMDWAEGPMLDEAACSSFIGRWSIPVRHSCTIGELALYFRRTRLPQLQLEVIPCTGWSRAMHVLKPGNSIFPPSPALQQPQAVMLYPGLGLLEGVYINEGRGTDRPFSSFSAPWLQVGNMLDAISTKGIEGISFEEWKTTPAWGIFAGQQCSGVVCKITNPELFKPVAFGFRLIESLAEVHGPILQPRHYPTVANPTGEFHLDRLTGVRHALKGIVNGTLLPQTKVAGLWQSMVAADLIYGIG
ncbi:MAG: DUF1343 domain-containing protein [Chitinophagaceae bacterium]|nr:DUF1343 domain-containing protein [Chitinophagaceae bacterium]